MKIYDLHKDNMEIVYLKKEDRINCGTSSKGNQIKWFKDNIFYKLNLFGYENTSEVLISCLLDNISNLIIPFVEYNNCIIIENGRNLGLGCYSENFKSNNYTELSLARLLESENKSLGIGYNDCIEFLSWYLDDAKTYVDTIIILDYITLNEDRHFNNFSLLKKRKYFYTLSYI